MQEGARPTSQARDNNAGSQRRVAKLGHVYSKAQTAHAATRLCTNTTLSAPYPERSHVPSMARAC